MCANDRMMMEMARETILKLQKENDRLKAEIQDMYEDLSDIKDHLIDVLNEKHELEIKLKEYENKRP